MRQYQYEIAVDNIPVRTEPKYRAKYPFPILKIGQSFFTKTNNLTILKNYVARRSSQLNRKFVVVKEKQGVRIGRIA